MIKLKNLKLDSNLFLAPMAGATNHAFRILCKKYNCGVTCTEMISSNAILQKNKKTLNMLNISDKEKPNAIQLFGNDVSIIGKAAKYISKNYEDKFNILDFNMGCPAPKIINNNAGSAILKDSKKIKNIVEELVSSTEKPVSIKIRIGFKNNKLNYLETSKIIEESGADLITVHGRTTEQGYSGIANWNAIKEIKQNIKIPVIGNGDIFSAEIAKEKIEKYKVDGVMIGRGALGNPRIFKQCYEYLKYGKYDKIKDIDRINDFLEYFKIAKKKELNKFELKSQAIYFSKGLKNAKKHRLNLIKLSETLDIVNYYKNLRKKYNDL